MKKIFAVLIVLALLSLACLETSSAIPDAPGAIAPSSGTLTNTPSIAAPRTAPTLTNATAARICARVIAETAVNLRPSAAASGGVMTWLKAGDVVQVIDSRDSEWWQVDRSGAVGFVKASYLRMEACQ